MCKADDICIRAGSSPTGAREQAEARERASERALCTCETRPTRGCRRTPFLSRVIFLFFLRAKINIEIYVRTRREILSRARYLCARARDADRGWTRGTTSTVPLSATVTALVLPYEMLNERSKDRGAIISRASRTAFPREERVVGRMYFPTSFVVPAACIFLIFFSSKINNFTLYIIILCDRLANGITESIN